MKFVKHTLAAAALMCAGAAQASSVTLPEGNLGSLTVFPSQFAGSYSRDGLEPFDATYFFNLSTQSNVFGSVAVLASFFGQPLAGITLLGAAIDGEELVTQFSPTATSGMVFSLGNLAAGEHTLTILGVPSVGNSAFTGSIYAQAVTQVPEPASLAIALAGIAVVGGLRARRNS